MSDERLTMRCVICSTNWPYHERFKVCPRCDDETNPLRLNHPTTVDDHILTLDEANVALASLYLPPVPTARRPAPIIGQSGAQHIPVNVDNRVRELRDDLDRWAHEVPPWLRK